MSYGFQQPPPGYQAAPPPYNPAMYERCAVIRNVSSGLVLDGSTYEVRLQSYNGSPAQLWLLESMGPGKFIIMNKGNGAALDIEGGPDCGATLITYERHGGLNQQWFVNPDNTIVSAAGELAVDICEGQCYPGNILIAYDRHGGPNQQFYVQYQ